MEFKALVLRNDILKQGDKFGRSGYDLAFGSDEGNKAVAGLFGSVYLFVAIGRGFRQQQRHPKQQVLEFGRIFLVGCEQFFDDGDGHKRQDLANFQIVLSDDFLSLLYGEGVLLVVQKGESSFQDQVQDVGSPFDGDFGI